ncbi:MAG: LamG domain-containing protein, partial [candidate division Zixibacteria bacterium]|nr:LamG domain-containing protein [candidate division Zixibacteria bacterium]
MKKRKILFKKPIIFGIAGIIVLGAFGSVGALNGWFGGGGSIPEDTFTRGLVGYWSFDERQGTTAADASGNGNHGTLYGPSWTAGKDGGALSFDGTNDYVDLNNPVSLQITDDLTIEFWVKFNSEQPSAQFTNPIGKDHSGTHGVTLQIDHTAGTPSQYWHVGNGSGLYSLNYSSVSLLDDAWHHLVLTKSITEGMAIYLDGQLAASNKTYTNPIAYNSGDWNFGRLTNITTRIAKMVGDELRFYSRTLSAEEVRYHYNRGGPVAHWKFDEGSGSTVYDSTDNNNDGTLYGEMATSTTHGWTTGKRGSALSFDGTDDYVQTPYLSVFNNHDFTIEFWFYRSESGHYDALFASKDSNSQGQVIFIRISADDLRFGFWSDDLDAVGKIAANKWIHAVFTWEANTKSRKIYLDGVLNNQDVSVSSLTVLSGLGSGNGVHIGKWDSNYHKGEIDDVRIYDYARTADEIKLDYNSGFAARFGPQTDCDRDPAGCMDEGLVGYWSFDERSGTTAADASGNSNDGTLVNSPTWSTGVKPFAGGASGGSALSFDGTDDYISINNNESLNITDSIISIEAWIKRTSLGTGYEGIVSKNNTGGYAVQLSWNSENHKVCFVEPNVNGICGNGLIDDFSWHHIVISIDGEYIMIYIDGALDKKADLPGSISGNDSDVEIGRRAIGENFSGYIDEVRIYSRALSAEEVRYHYNKGGPVAHWKFDEGSGSTAYDSANNNHGTWGGAGNHWVTGKYNTAGEFNGIDNYVNISDDDSLDIDPSNGITVAAWVKFNSTANTGFILSKYLNESNCPYEILYDRGWANGWLWEINDGTWKNVNYPMEPDTNTWYYVVGIYDGSNMKLYLDGKELVGAVRSISSITNNNDVIVGRRGQGAGYFNGSIDDVRIYNYARTPEQIKQDYNEGFAARFGPQTDCDRDPAGCLNEGLVGYWSFDERSGTIAADASDSGNDGTLVNGPTWTTGIKPLSGGVSGGSALSLDGINDYVDAGSDTDLDNVFEGTQQFTVELWLNSKVGTPRAEVVWSKWLADPFGGGVFRINDSRVPYFHIRDGENVMYALAPTGVTLDKWHHIAVVRDAQNITVYLDAIAGTPVATSLNISAADASLLIGYAVLNNYFTGSIDEVRAYNRALSVEEIRYHYNRGGPVAHWKFDEGSGITAYDETSNNNDGTLYGEMATSTTYGWTEGRHGSALSFDGTDDYVNAGNDGSL